MTSRFLYFCRQGWRWRHTQSDKTLSINVGSPEDVRNDLIVSDRNSDALSNRLAGPPLTNNNLVSLMENQVTVAVGVPDAWAARNARFDIAWVRCFKSIPIIVLTGIFSGKVGVQRTDRRTASLFSRLD
jgi:hypothetical protein